MPENIEEDDGESAKFSWQERFRQALADGDELAVAKALREANTLDRSAIEALVNLFEGGATDHGSWSLMYPHKLVFKKKRRGRPTDNNKHWVERPQIANEVAERAASSRYKKTAVYDVAKTFGVSRTTILNAVAATRKKHLKAPDDT
jgi:hypothetical protein